MTISKLDWDIVHSRVVKTRNLHPGKHESWAFLRLVLQQFFPADQDEWLTAITDGPNDRGIDAIHIIESDQSAEVFLFQAKYRESERTSSKTINDSEALRLTAFVEDLFSKSDDLVETGNEALRQKVLHIWDLHQRGIICRYRVVFCSNDQGLSNSAAKILEAIVDKYDQVSFEHYGTQQLISDLGAYTKRSETGILQVLGRELFERSDGNVRGVIASVDPTSFIELISSDDRKSIKRHLFDDNLRIFLGTSGGYNGQIIETATTSDSYLFWYLNNGITITCKNYSYNKGHSNPKIILTDFQIVNGAQTSHSLLEAYRSDPEAFENIVLLARIYATDETDIVERVAVATNSQAKIQSRDLRANQPILKKLEIAFKDRGIFFERKRNMYADQPEEHRLDALKLGQIILSFYFSEPERARSESDSIFGNRFNDIFHDRYNFDELVLVVKLYQKIEAMRDNYHEEFAGHIESGGQYQYLVYGHWFILFAAKMILAKRSEGLPEAKDSDALIEEAITLVAKACSQQKAVAHYQMFRSSKTKHKILEELSGKQLDMFTHLAG